MDKAFKGKLGEKIIKEGDVILLVVPAKKLVKINTEILKW